MRFPGQFFFRQSDSMVSNRRNPFLNRPIGVNADFWFVGSVNAVHADPGRLRLGTELLAPLINRDTK